MLCANVCAALCSHAIIFWEICAAVESMSNAMLQRHVG